MYIAYVLSSYHDIFTRINVIGGVIVSLLSSSVVDRELEPQSDRIKDNEIGIFCFPAKHIALRRKTGWLPWNRDNVSECGDISIRRLFFQ